MPDSQNPANRMNEFMEAKQSGPNCNVYGSGIFLKLGNAADLLPKVNRIKISLFSLLCLQSRYSFLYINVASDSQFNVLTLLFCWLYFFTYATLEFISGFHFLHVCIKRRHVRVLLGKLVKMPYLKTWNISNAV